MTSRGFCRCTLAREGRIWCRAGVAALAFWGGPVGGGGMQKWRFFTGFGGCGEAMLLAVWVAASMAWAAEPLLLAPDERAIIDKVTTASRAGNVQYGTAPVEVLGGEIAFPFRDGTITLVRTTSFVREDGSISWRGIVKETGERAALMVWGNAVLTGYFAYDGTIFAIENLGGGLHAFAELGRDKALPDHPAPAAARDSAPMPDLMDSAAPRSPPAEPRIAAFADKERQALEAKTITIDVMLLYTPNVAARYVRDPGDLLAVAIDETNESFRNSGLGNISLRLVHTQPLNYDGSMEDQFTHLYTMVDGIGAFKNVKKLRNEKRADVVGLIIDNPNGCGLSTRVGPESDEAFFVVHHACVTVSMSMAHEIGHILGIRHDRFADSSDMPIAYGHGYVNGTKWRDIMSYNVGCGGCPRIPFWSNPRVIYNGEPTGTAAADSARVLLENAERISKFR
jgi:Metallo-peptidase family M12